MASLGMLPPVMVVKMLGGLFGEVVLVFSCQVEVEENIKKKQRVLEEKLLGQDCENLEKMAGNATEEDIIDAEAEFGISISEDVTLSEQASLSIRM